MAIATADEFLTLYEDFNTLDPDVIQNHIDFIDRNYCLTTPWLNNTVARKDAVLLLCAHFGTLRWLQSAQIIASSLAVSGGSSPSMPQATEDHYKLTLYGQQFLELRKRVSSPHTGFAFG